MPKKQAKNAFFYYMLDVKRREEESGRSFPGGLADVSILASAKWNAMSRQERIPYEKQAKSTNRRVAGDLYSSQGIPYQMVERARNEQQEAVLTMKSEIVEMVQKSYQNNTIAEQPYYFIAVNHFCCTLTYNRYYPAELALLRYTLADGYTKRLHTFINPGHLPAGYAFEAQEHSQKMHGIEPPPRAVGESDYARIMHDLVEFIGGGDDGGADNDGDAAAGGDGRRRRLPPLFTDVHQLEAVRSTVEQLCRAAGRQDTVRVYPLVQLFYVLKREALRYALDEPDAGFQSEHVAQAMLDRDRYDLRDEIACQFHQNLDRSKQCALSMVTRYCFMLSDHCCMDLGIELVLGKHVPADSDVVAAQQHKTELDAVRAMSKCSFFYEAGAGDAGGAGAGDKEDHSDVDSETDNTKYDSGTDVASSINYTQYMDDSGLEAKMNVPPQLSAPYNPFLRRHWPKPREPFEESFPQLTTEQKPINGWGRGRLV